MLAHHLCSSTPLVLKLKGVWLVITNCHGMRVHIHINMLLSLKQQQQQQQQHCFMCYILFLCRSFAEEVGVRIGGYFPCYSG